MTTGFVGPVVVGCDRSGRLAAATGRREFSGGSVRLSAQRERQNWRETHDHATTECDRGGAGGCASEGTGVTGRPARALRRSGPTWARGDGRRPSGREGCESISGPWSSHPSGRGPPPQLIGTASSHHEEPCSWPCDMPVTIVELWRRRPLRRVSGRLGGAPHCLSGNWRPAPACNSRTSPRSKPAAPNPRPRRWTSCCAQRRSGPQSCSTATARMSDERSNVLAASTLG